MFCLKVLTNEFDGYIENIPQKNTIPITIEHLFKLEVRLKNDKKSVANLIRSSHFLVQFTQVLIAL